MISEIKQSVSRGNRKHFFHKLKIDKTILNYDELSPLQRKILPTLELNTMLTATENTQQDLSQ